MMSQACTPGNSKRQMLQARYTDVTSAGNHNSRINREHLNLSATGIETLQHHAGSENWHTDPSVTRSLLVNSRLPDINGIIGPMPQPSLKAPAVSAHENPDLSGQGYDDPMALTPRSDGNP